MLPLVPQQQAIRQQHQETNQLRQQLDRTLTVLSRRLRLIGSVIMMFTWYVIFELLYQLWINSEYFVWK